MALFIAAFISLFNYFSGFDHKSDITHFLAIQSKLTVPNNDTFNLSKFKGKVVILQFWASWSKTSRLDNKNLVRIYQKYKSNSKIVIVSVSLDTDEASWKAAIEEDYLEWKNQYCDFKKYDSPMAAAYHVNTIPVINIFDKSGRLFKAATKVQDIESDIDGLLN